MNHTTKEGQIAEDVREIVMVLQTQEGTHRHSIENELTRRSNCS
jgi:hypothetical protein